MAGIKRSTADDAFSKCIRERADYFCERCGLNCRNMPAYLDCSHIITRSSRSIRWDKNNAVAHCKKCHDWWHKHPAIAGRWADEYLGREHIDSLYLKANSKLKRKYPKTEEKEIAKHYRNELKKMQEQRNDGKQGRIEFESYQ